MRPAFHHLSLIAGLVMAEPLPALTAGAPAASAASAGLIPAAPPALPDGVRVANGCHVSAVRYVARFEEAHPHESAATIVITPADARGPRRSAHTIVLLTWQGYWWGRDEYYGVFPLHLATRHPVSKPRLVALAEAAYVRHGRASPRVNSERLAQRGAELTPEQRLADVQTAAHLMPLPSRIYVATGPEGEIPLLLFHPEPGWIGVYDPQHGTALAPSGSFDGVRVVRQVARHLGYRVDQIRAHPRLTPGQAVAAGAATARPRPPHPAPGEPPAPQTAFSVSGLYVRCELACSRRLGAVYEGRKAAPPSCG